MRHTRSIILSFTAFLLLGAFVYWKLPFLPIPLSFTEIWRYKQLVNSASPSGLLSHFPEDVPKDAKNVRFYYRPGILQGGTAYQIRMQLPSSSIQNLNKMFSEKKTKSFWGGSNNNHMNEKNGMPTTDFYTNRNQDDFHSLSFPADYEIMIFDRLLTESERPPGFYWNHGRSHGVAVSTKRSEIIYWAEKW